MPAGEVDHHVSAAPQIAGARIAHRHGEAGRDGSIDRIAAAPEHLDADLRRARFLGHHLAVRCGSLGGGVPDGEQKEG